MEYILVFDNDGHWYVIPAHEAGAWARFLESEAAELDEVPGYAEPVNGAPSNVRFKEWHIE